MTDDTTSAEENWKYTVTSVSEGEQPARDEYFDESLGGFTPTEWLIMLVPAFVVLQGAMLVLNRGLYWYEAVGVLALVAAMYPVARYRARLREQFLEEKYDQ